MSKKAIYLTPDEIDLVWRVLEYASARLEERQGNTGDPTTILAVSWTRDCVLTLATKFRVHPPAAVGLPK